MAYRIEACDTRASGLAVVVQLRIGREAGVGRRVRLRQVRAGVEAALGPPTTKVDLGEKVLYKYKDMTVEFHDGKVTDVR